MYTHTHVQTLTRTHACTHTHTQMALNEFADETYEEFSKRLGFQGDVAQALRKQKYVCLKDWVLVLHNRSLTQIANKSMCACKTVYLFCTTGPEPNLPLILSTHTHTHTHTQEGVQCSPAFLPRRCGSPRCH